MCYKCNGQELTARYRDNEREIKSKHARDIEGYEERMDKTMKELNNLKIGCQL